MQCERNILHLRRWLRLLCLRCLVASWTRLKSRYCSCWQLQPAECAMEFRPKWLTSPEP